MTTFQINGRSVSVDVEDETPLLWVIRDVIGLTGTKFGCGIGMCGACTVHVGGRPTRSCITPVSSVANAEITTIEGLDPRGQHPLQKAWIDLQVPQCGYCQSGQIMQAASLLKDLGRFHAEGYRSWHRHHLRTGTQHADLDRMRCAYAGRPQRRHGERREADDRR
jgi:isoquinoline 1-oxidoreductase alpha subunit